MLIDLAVLVKNDCPCPEKKPKTVARKTVRKPKLPERIVVRDTVYVVKWRDCSVWAGGGLALTESEQLGSLEIGGRRESFGLRAELERGGDAWRARMDALWFKEFDPLRGYIGGGLMASSSLEASTVIVYDEDEHEREGKKEDDDAPVIVSFDRAEREVGPSIVVGVESRGRTRAFGEVRLWFEKEVEPSAALGVRFAL